MKRVTILLLSITFVTLLSAQSGPENLVPNWSFEEFDTKIKGPGEAIYAAPWEAVTMNPIDLYSARAKSDEFSVPRNKYGEEKARTGESYVGVSFFGYRGKLPRTYLGTKLKSPMEAGKEYCLKFHLSMSDMSKYAVNNIGMYVSKEHVDQMNDANIYLEPQLISVTNRVYDKQFSWEAVCGSYTAEGGEQYIVIGNFAKDADTKQQTVRLSREFSGRQSYDAYYFIDDVSVIPIEIVGKKGCACEKIAGGQMTTEFKRFGTDINDTRKAEKTYLINSDGTKAGEKGNIIEKKEEEASTEEDGTVYKTFNSEPAKEEEVKKEYSPADVVIYYDDKQFKVPESESEAVSKLLEYLKSNPTVNIELQGHSDPSESEVQMIGKRRAILLYSHLTKNGISKDRVSYVGQETKMKASEDDPSQNRRVTISLK